ncbi:MAG: preprotein translocase subunit SecG [Betaproteobacteria bacterium]|nr:preprotein translocase subunit SecG [Betaproteobacteria bacterium]
MTVMLTILLAVQMLSAVAMMGLILIQHGKGADMGAASTFPKSHIASGAPHAIRVIESRRRGEIGRHAILRG